MSTYDGAEIGIDEHPSRSVEQTCHSNEPPMMIWHDRTIISRGEALELVKQMAHVYMNTKPALHDPRCADDTENRVQQSFIDIQREEQDRELSYPNVLIYWMAEELVHRLQCVDRCTEIKNMLGITYPDCDQVCVLSEASLIQETASEEEIARFKAIKDLVWYRKHILFPNGLRSQSLKYVTYLSLVFAMTNWDLAHIQKTIHELPLYKLDVEHIEYAIQATMQ